mgnify:FL=1|tara:strand:+ start:4120 stop:4668 length:549 start_codon:yes stop_codon:yes gene_type:complete
MERTIKIHKIKIFITLILFVFLALISCSSEEVGNNNQLEKIVNPTLKISITELSIPKFKLGKKYKVDDLPEAIAVSRAIFNKKDIEIREYETHQEAIQFGEKFASSVSGKDAIVSGDNVMWKEGAKDRRKCVPRAGNSEAGCDQTPRFGGYMILGNLIILCEGLSDQESLELCHSFKNSITQ